MMNILWIARFPIDKGHHPAPWLAGLADELVSAGHRLDVLTPHPKAATIRRVDTGIGYELIILPYKGGLRHLISGFQTQITAVAAWLKDHSGDYDIIHVHGTELQYTSSLLAIQTKTPYILSIQGIITLYKKELPRKLSKQYLYWTLSSLYEKKEVRQTQNFFCRTDWDQQFVTNLRPNADITVCWEVLRSEFFDYIPSFNGKDILFMGGDNPIKAFALSLQVFNRLAALHPEIRLRVVGSVNKKEYDRLLSVMSLKNITSRNVLMEGSLDAKGICEVYKNCFCLYHPSLIDNSPNSVCEAQVAGLPVVATRVGGVASLIRDGETGLLVEKNDLEGHVRALDQLFRDPALQQRLGKASRVLARERHDGQSIVEKTLSTYQKLANKKMIPHVIA